MNNAARGVILALALLGMGFMFFGMIESASPDEYEKGGDLPGVLAGGFGMVSCAVMGAAALAGMKPTPPTSVTFPHQQQGAVPPYAQPYPQPGAMPQPGAVPQQYAPQQPPPPQ
ncbi:hypothetical protein [Actinomadura formosensis]|uniref:hypothetical protein n=1 Tax=Actinomadura formosensis TaxID=60706 RepID=UPI003D8AA7C2